MNIFKKITSNGKSIYCYGFNKFQAMSFVDPDKGDTFKRFHFFGDIAYGMCIEPLFCEHADRVNSGLEVKLPSDEFQDDSLCLFFSEPDKIDALIDKLKECKKRLNAKIFAARKEEYRRKYYGQIVHIDDLRVRDEARRECLRALF